MKMLLVVAAGGAVGAVGRYLVIVGVGMIGVTHFPVGTIVVNVVGSFLLGVLVEASALFLSMGQELRAFLVVGILGAFTTFSTFSMDVIALIERHQAVQAAANIVSSIVLSVGAFFVAMRLVKWMVT